MVITQLKTNMHNQNFIYRNNKIMETIKCFIVMKNRHLRLFIHSFMVFIFSIGFTTLFGQVNYVKPVATGTGDGSSWANASADLQAMIDAPGTSEVWVAEGTYYPGTLRTDAYEMKNNVAIYGGFDGTETMLSQRDWTTNVTILSGDIGVLGDTTDNCYHVIFNDGNRLNGTAILDGLTITSGNANGSFQKGRGAGMHNWDSSPKIENCLFSNNSSMLEGGGMYNALSEPSVINSTFKNNTSTKGGGMANFMGAPFIRDCTFDSNTASTLGGGMYNQECDAAVRSCTFTANRGQAGGGMANNLLKSLDNDYYLTVDNCIFTNNVATDPVRIGGGGVYNFSSGPLFTNCTFDGNTAISLGGGMYSEENSDATVQNCTFTANEGSSGGGMCNDLNSNVSVDNCLFSNNETTDPNGGGGGIYNRGSDPTVVNSTFSNNQVARGGGIRNNLSSPQINNCFFMNNTAVLGGGILNFKGSPLITNCTFDGNITSSQGGGMYSNECPDAIVQNCTFTGNQGSSGGGMCNDINSALTVENCIFSNNVSTNPSGGGGGMLNLTSDPAVINSIFISNVAQGFSGGILNSMSSPIITNCSFSGNSSPGGGGGISSLEQSFPIITNSILWGNSTGIGYDPTSTPVVNYCILQGLYPGTDNLVTDPFFVNQPPVGLGSGNLRLTSCSPALNVGQNDSIPEGVTHDLVGNPRIDNAGTVDLGAYELQSGPGTISKLFVDTDATGSNDGNSWANAFINLQDALNANCPNITEIWVAAGTYYPGIARTDAFEMINNLAIYGGFNGTETMLSQRDYTTNITVLSGDIGIPMDNADNSYHVVNNSTGSSLDSTAVLDGFTITGGNASEPTVPHNSGGGMFNSYSSPKVENCFFTNNSAEVFGGGIFNQGANTQVINCRFSNNQSNNYGGGICNRFLSAKIENCSFFNNSAVLDGGGMYNTSGDPNVINCIFSGNSADRYGGGISIKDSTSTIINCSFSGNTSTLGGGGLDIENCTPIITNSILWGNSSEIANAGSIEIVSYSIVQGGYTGVGNLDTDPLFENDLRISSCSPARNAGNNLGLPPGLTVDLDGNPRIYNNNIVDIGAYELQRAPITSNIIFVNASSTGLNDGRSWTDAFVDLQDALNTNCPQVSEIWVAAGTYYPGTLRTDAFVMKNNVAIYGGFDGTETMLSQRDWVANTTILSGDIGTPGNNADNSYHVISNQSNGLNATAVLSGFTITAGNANSTTYPNETGGGMTNINSSPRIEQCVFMHNNAVIGGGGMNNQGAIPMIINSTFIGNNCASGGGGMNNLNASPSIINCAFSGNNGNAKGGAIANFNSTPMIYNSILWGNSSEIHDFGNSTPDVSFSIVQGGATGAGNLDVDPVFVNQPPVGFGSTGDLHLNPCSPAIDGGANAYITGVATDLDGNERIFNNDLVDIGPYEDQRQDCNPLDSDMDGIVDSVDLCPDDKDTALEFDGVNDHVLVPHNSALNITSDDFTLVAWVNPSGQGLQTILAKGNATGMPVDFAIILLQVGNGYLLDLNLETESHTVTSTLIKANEWSHVAVSYNATTKLASFFINGVMVETSTFAITPVPSDMGALFIGQLRNDGNNFQGRLDNVTIWNRLMSVDEIIASMDQILDGQESGLVANYNMNDGFACGDNSSHLTATDISLNAFNGTLVNFNVKTNCSSGWTSGPNKDSDGDLLPACVDLCPGTKDVALDFIGLDNFLAFNYNLPIVDADFAFEAWVNPADENEMGVFFGQDSDVNPTFGLILRNRKIALVLFEDATSNNPEYLYSNTNVPSNQWSHIAVSFDAATKQAIFYLNGQYDGIRSSQLPSIYNPNIGTLLFGLGRDASGVSSFFKGGMDDLTIWSRSLSEYNINQTMAAPLEGTENGLVAFFDFNEGIPCADNTTITTAINKNSNNNNANLIGFDLTTCTSNYVMGKNLDSDGDMIGDACDVIEFGCPPNYTGANQLIGEQRHSVFYDTDGAIESKQIIKDSSRVTYNTNTSIELLMNFEANLGTTLEMKMDGCPD